MLEFKVIENLKSNKDLTNILKDFKYFDKSLHFYVKYVILPVMDKFDLRFIIQKNNLRYGNCQRRSYNV